MVVRGGLEPLLRPVMSQMLYLLSYRTKLVFALPRSSRLHGRAARKDDEKERGWSPVLVMTQENAFAPGDVRGSFYL